jgi:hypothetical protein
MTLTVTPDPIGIYWGQIPIVLVFIGVRSQLFW